MADDDLAWMLRHLQAELWVTQQATTFLMQQWIAGSRIPPDDAMRVLHEGLSRMLDDMPGDLSSLEAERLIASRRIALDEFIHRLGKLPG